jgi:nitrous oxidase accessory protein
MDWDLERVFLELAVLVVVGSVLAAVAAPVTVAAPARSGGEAGTGFVVDTTVPQEYDFGPATAVGVATLDGREYDSLQSAVDVADPGDTIQLRGRFDERVTVPKDNVTLASAPGHFSMIHGPGEGDVLTITGENVTVRRVWINNSGREARTNDAGIWIDGNGTRIVDARVTEITFGIWIDSVDDVTVANTTIVGREEVTPLSYRGNGIELHETADTVVRNNSVTDVRDGLYYSFATNVTAHNNTMWDMRYGVHYMYSDQCVLRDNLAFDNDAGYALMVSQHLRIEDNVAVKNTGQSGHGILVKSIDDTQIRNNTVVGNEHGFYVYNSANNTISRNLVLENQIGVQLTAGSITERVYGNSFINNRQDVLAVTPKQVAWNRSGDGNYWSNAQVVDRNRDGVSEVRYRPAGLVEQLVHEHPEAAVFANSPAFDAIRLARSTLPVVEARGVVDHHPLVRPKHPNWRTYYAGD